MRKSKDIAVKSRTRLAAPKPWNQYSS